MAVHLRVIDTISSEPGYLRSGEESSGVAGTGEEQCSVVIQPGLHSKTLSYCGKKSNQCIARGKCLLGNVVRVP